MLVTSQTISELSTAHSGRLIVGQKLFSEPCFLVVGAMLMLFQADAVARMTEFSSSEMA